MYQIKELLKYKNLQHAISTLDDGNMSFKFDSKQKVFNNRKRFFKKNSINPKDVIDMGPRVDMPDQVVFVKAKNRLNSLDEKNEPVWGDALITNKKKYYLALNFADCFGIIFYEPRKKILALTHAGYIPVSHGIILKTLKKLKKDFKIDVKKLVVAITPGIWDCCLKGRKIHKPELEIEKAKKYIFKNGKMYSLDILKWILDDLKANKIEEVVISNFCSACSKKNKFYSHHMQKEKKQKFGRNILVVGMK